MSEPLTHDTAIVEDGAVVGPGTRVWHHAHIRSGAVIGSDCTLGKNVYIGADVRVGDRCKIQNNVSVYEGVTLESDVFVGPSAVFTNDLFPRADSGVGWELTTTTVRRGASIGANATVICGTELGPWCLVAAGAVVTESVGAYELVAGVPARRVGWVCRCGNPMSRGGDSMPLDLTCPRCNRVFDGALDP